ncbi:MAG: hypothetical protein PF692_08550 [Kiritimatiellae bacterium]|jgi:hypothetical protein|nr:hypothetical protein [Kiritimatiellia bacterium]
MKKLIKNNSKINSKFIIVLTNVAILFLCFHTHLLNSETLPDTKFLTSLGVLPNIVLDGQGSISFFDYDYQLQIVNEGLKGYNKVVKTIENKPSREVLAVNLNCLSAFYASYNKIGATSYCKNITSIVNKLLKSDNLDDVQAIVTSIYYDLDFSATDSNKQMVDQLEKLRTTSKDEYTVRFATLCLNKMYKLSGLKVNKYPVPSVVNNQQSPEK